MNAQHENKEFIQNTSFPRNDSLQTKETKATTLIANVLETGSNDSMILQNDCRSMNKEKDMQIPNDDSDDDTKSYCVICLNTCEDRTVLETCHHEFCFHCILQWSMISHSCPLCIQVFESCIHNILDDLNYTVHRFEKPTSSSKGPSTGSPSSSTSSATSRRQQQIAVPYGIIRQLYGPAQRRRRFRNPPNVDLAEQTVTEHQQSALEKRRHVYRHRLFVKHIGANRITGFQQITPETFRIFPHKLDRLIPWVRRELQAILSLASPPTSDSSTSASGPSETTYDLPQGADRGVELIREYIIAVMKRYDLQTDQGQDLLRDFLYEHTEQFVHELMGFARSPYSIDAYDRVAQYGSPSSASASTSAQIERSDSHDLNTGTSDSMWYRNHGRREYSTRNRSSEYQEQYRGRRRPQRRNESPDQRSRSRHRRRSRSRSSDTSHKHKSESSRFSKRRRGSNEDSVRNGNGDTRSRSKSRVRGRSRDRHRSRSNDRDRSRSRTPVKHLEKNKSRNIGVNTRSVAELPNSLETSKVLKSNASERNKDNKADAVLIEGMEGIKPGDSPLKNRDVVMATLQAKLKRERDLYAANNHNKPATK